MVMPAHHTQLRFRHGHTVSQFVSVQDGAPARIVFVILLPFRICATAEMCSRSSNSWGTLNSRWSGVTLRLLRPIVLLSISARVQWITGGCRTRAGKPVKSDHSEHMRARAFIGAHVYFFIMPGSIIWTGCRSSCNSNRKKNKNLGFPIWCLVIQ